MDIGNFKDLHNAVAKDENDNYVRGENIHTIDIDNTYIRNELVKKGKKHVKTFSWQRMAEQTLAVYEKYGRKS
jgi:mannose-1-phosphate guanylyltransferase